MQTAGPADAYGQAQRTAGAPAAARPAYGLPQQVTMKAGTFVTVRINEMLASNKNQPGDSFSGTLAQAIVVDGVVVAQRGQTVYGRVTQADKVKGVSHLGVELTGFTLADGEQVSVHSQLISRQGGMTPPGQQAGSIVGTAGVLTTHSHPSILYPGTATTFQIQNPLTIATGNAPQAFRFVGPEDYNRATTQVVQTAPVQRPGYYSPYYGYGYGYGPYYGYSPYYWGPSFYGGGFWGGGFRFGGGFRRFR